LDDVPEDWGRCVVTIGVFDGVHRGHQAIIARAVERAREVGLPSVVLTFNPHPSEVVRPGSHPPELTTQTRRSELVGGLGVDVFCALPFTTEFSLLEPADFVHAALVDRLHTAQVLVGENFRFGHGAAGDVAMLTALGERFGYSASGIELLEENGVVVSATYIRGRVAAGDMAAAIHALARPHRVDGLVERGDQRGRALGYPTANLRPEKYAAIPADGVYAGVAWQLDERGQTGERLGAAAISVGTNPTFEGHERRVEAYILDFAGDLYGQGLGIEFVSRLRGMERFDSVDALVAQMRRDVADTRALVPEA